MWFNVIHMRHHATGPWWPVMARHGPNFGAVSPKSGETLRQQLEELRLEAQTVELEVLQPDKEPVKNGSTYDFYHGPYAEIERNELQKKK